MSDSNQHWGFCPSVAFSIATICIPSVKLPQLIQTTAMLNPQTTEGRHCAPRPQLARANNQTVTAERKQLRGWDCVCKRFSLDSETNTVYCCRRRNAVNNQRAERNTSDSQRHGSRVSEPSPLRCLTANGKRPRASAGIELCHSIPRSSTHLCFSGYSPPSSPPPVCLGAIFAVTRIHSELS